MRNALTHFYIPEPTQGQGAEREQNNDTFLGVGFEATRSKPGEKSNRWLLADIAKPK